MTISRVSTYNTHLIAINTLNQKQSQIADINNKMSSGVQYQTIAEMSLDGQTRRVVDFGSTLNQINSYQRNNTVVKTRLEMMDSSIDSMETMMSEAVSAMVQERSSSGSVLPLKNQLEAILQQMEDRLNVSAGGRYLFSGSRTTDKPVENILTSNVSGGGGPLLDTYYHGDNVDLTHQASDDVSITTTVRANDQAFREMIGSLHMAIQAETDGSDSGLANAIDAANKAILGLSGLRNDLRNNLSTLDRVAAQHNNLQTYYKQTIGELMGTNVPEASIELAMDESILTASFQVFARVSNLTLSNYLK